MHDGGRDPAANRADQARGRPGADHDQVRPEPLDLPDESCRGRSATDAGPDREPAVSMHAQEDFGMARGGGPALPAVDAAFGRGATQDGHPGERRVVKVQERGAGPAGEQARGLGEHRGGPVAETGDEKRPAIGATGVMLDGQDRDAATTGDPHRPCFREAVPEGGRGRPMDDDQLRSVPPGKIGNASTIFLRGEVSTDPQVPPAGIEGRVLRAGSPAAKLRLGPCGGRCAGRSPTPAGDQVEQVHEPTRSEWEPHGPVEGAPGGA